MSYRDHRATARSVLRCRLYFVSGRQAKGEIEGGDAAIDRKRVKVTLLTDTGALRIIFTTPTIDVIDVMLSCTDGCAGRLIIEYRCRDRYRHARGRMTSLCSSTEKALTEVPQVPFALGCALIARRQYLR